MRVVQGRRSIMSRVLGASGWLGLLCCAGLWVLAGDLSGAQVLASPKLRTPVKINLPPGTALRHEACVAHRLRRPATRPLRVLSSRRSSAPGGKLIPTGALTQAQILPEPNLEVRVLADPLHAGPVVFPTSGPAALNIELAAGEYEAAAFVVRGGQASVVVGVAASPLVARGVGSSPGGPGRIAAQAVSFREVQSSAVRRRFTAPATEVVARFAPRSRSRPLAAKELREFLVEVSVPVGTTPGAYVGAVLLRVDGRTRRLGLRLRVRDVSLPSTASKPLGMYYRMYTAMSDEPRVRAELRDMRNHGIENLVVDLRPVIRRSDDGWAVDVSLVQRGLELIAEAGFTGTVVLDAGLVALARAVGHQDVAYSGARGESLGRGLHQPFADLAKRSLQALEREAQRQPQLDLVLVHLDEVFNNERFELFLRLAAVARRHCSLPIYATFSTVDATQDRARERLDPFVDLRGHHGYTFEWWLARGHLAKDYSEQLRASGDRAWFYHNARGTYFTPQWARLVNGLYLWASPFSSHVTWAYQAFQGDPLDDSDGAQHDYGVAFVDPHRPGELMPTRAYLALREGYDDLRYLDALSQALRQHRDARPGVAIDVDRFLQSLREEVLTLPAGLDVAALPQQRGTALEAPLLRSLAQRFDAARMQRLRADIEGFITELSQL